MGQPAESKKLNNNTADNQLNAKPRLSKGVRMQHFRFHKEDQGQLLEGVECHIYLYCFTFDDINLNRAFVIIVLFPKKYSNKKVCANDLGKLSTLGIY